jgi:hypothetical protein
MACDEGSYFIACNPTPGTGLAGHAAPTDISLVTKALVQVGNYSAAEFAKRITLHYIKLTVTAPGTAGSIIYFAEELDTGDRYTSGGTQLTPLSPFYGGTNPSSSEIAIYAGAVVCPAANANKEIGSGCLRTVIPVVGDTYMFIYQRWGGAPQASTVLSGTAPAAVTVYRPPVVLGPNEVFNHHQAQTSQSAASSFEVEVAGWFR